MEAKNSEESLLPSNPVVADIVTLKNADNVTEMYASWENEKSEKIESDQRNDLKRSYEESLKVHMNKKYWLYPINRKIGFNVFKKRLLSDNTVEGLVNDYFDYYTFDRCSAKQKLQTLVTAKQISESSPNVAQ